MKQPINESNDRAIIDKWYDDARGMKLENLQQWITDNMEKYKHDYGTIVHFIAACSLATFNALASEAGISGFQAGAVMWQIIRGIEFRNNKTGLRIINYDDMLFPQYEDKFTKRTISKKMFETMQEEAKKKLEESGTAHENVIAHWKSIVAGQVPFGYSLEE